MKKNFFEALAGLTNTTTAATVKDFVARHMVLGFGKVDGSLSVPVNTKHFEGCTVLKNCSEDGVIETSVLGLAGNNIVAIEAATAFGQTYITRIQNAHFDPKTGVVMSREDIHPIGKGSREIMASDGATWVVDPNYTIAAAMADAAKYIKQVGAAA